MNSLKFQDRLLGLQDNLLNFAYMLTANREEAKDLLQDTTLKALDNEDKYIDNVNFKGWVFTIMRNIFINNYRRVVRNQTIIDQTEDLYHLNLPQDSGFASPEGSFTVKEITTAINSFSEEYRIPFSMHVAGYKYHEIAEKMDLPLGTVKSRIFTPRSFNCSILRPKSNIWFIPYNAAAASVLPPAMPAATGICFSKRNSTPSVIENSSIKRAAAL